MNYSTMLDKVCNASTGSEADGIVRAVARRLEAATGMHRGQDYTNCAQAMVAHYFDSLFSGRENFEGSVHSILTLTAYDRWQHGGGNSAEENWNAATDSMAGRVIDVAISRLKKIQI